MARLPFPDLPGPWRAAAGVPTKARAKGNGVGFRGRPSVKVLRDPTSGGRIVVVKNAVYRCEQPVEAFVLFAEKGISVLIQPKDMNPTKVARCTCLLDIAVAVPGAVSTTPAQHEQILDVYLRGDRYGAKLGMPHVDRLRLSSGPKIGSWGSLWNAPWKRAAVDAWDDYRETLRGYWS